MQELNKAYLTLINDDKRAEYDKGSDGELQSLEVPFEVDEESANKNKVKLGSVDIWYKLTKCQL